MRAFVSVVILTAAENVCFMVSHFVQVSLAQVMAAGRWRALQYKPYRKCSAPLQPHKIQRRRRLPSHIPLWQIFELNDTSHTRGYGPLGAFRQLYASLRSLVRCCRRVHASWRVCTVCTTDDGCPLWPLTAYIFITEARHQSGHYNPLKPAISWNE